MPIRLDGFLIDDHMYETLSKRKWKPNKDGYAVGSVNIRGKNNRSWKTKIAMHRVIIEAKEGEIVDHINGDKTDNRRENLRIVTAFQNTINSTSRKGSSSQYKGVSFRLKNGQDYWIARMSIKGKTVLEKWFRNEDEAARAYDEAAKIYHGEYARLNFPNL